MNSKLLLQKLVGAVVNGETYWKKKKQEIFDALLDVNELWKDTESAQNGRNATYSSIDAIVSFQLGAEERLAEAFCKSRTR